MSLAGAPERKDERRRWVLQLDTGELSFSVESVAFQFALKKHHAAWLFFVQSSPVHSLGRDFEIIPAQHLLLPRLHTTRRLSDNAPVYDFDAQNGAARAGRIGAHRDIADP